MAVYPFPLLRPFPPSVHLANTQPVLQLNSQHYASYYAGSEFEIICPAWTLSSSSPLPSVECRSLLFEHATIISSQSSLHIHSHISATIYAVYTVSLGPIYSYSHKPNIVRGDFMIVWPCIVTYSLWKKPTDALNSTFIGITTLHVPGSLSAHHQEFLTYIGFGTLCAVVMTVCYQE